MRGNLGHPTNRVRTVEGRGRKFAVWMITGEGETEALRLGLLMRRAA